MFNLKDLHGQRVEVYRDLRRGHYCWSIRSPKAPKKVLNYNGTGPSRTKVRTQIVALEDCVFKVSEAGRLRTLKEQKKNVHAWVVGTVVDPEDVRDLCTQEVTYNAFKYYSFVLAAKTNIPVLKAERVLFDYPKVKIPKVSRRRMVVQS